VADVERLRPSHTDQTEDLELRWQTGDLEPRKNGMEQDGNQAWRTLGLRCFQG
jgi:hypothetical protein